MPPPTSVPPSGESVRLSDEGLTAKVRRRQTWYGDGWEDVVRMEFEWLGDGRANRTDLTTLWRDPEVHTESEHADALVKMLSLGVPAEALWAMLPNVTPAQVEAWRALSAASPPTPPAPPAEDNAQQEDEAVP